MSEPGHGVLATVSTRIFRISHTGLAFKKQLTAIYCWCFPAANLDRAAKLNPIPFPLAQSTYVRT